MRRGEQTGKGGGTGQTFYVGDSGGYDDVGVDEEMDGSKDRKIFEGASISRGL